MNWLRNLYYRWKYRGRPKRMTITQPGTYLITAYMYPRAGEPIKYEQTKFLQPGDDIDITFDTERMEVIKL